MDELSAAVDFFDRATPIDTLLVLRPVPAIAVLIACALVIGCERPNVPPPAAMVAVPAKRDRAPLTPAPQAAADLAVPPGFQVSLFASEPVVRQPIALATDARGRLWVAENNTYNGHMQPFDRSQRDRIVILEDADHDGRAEKHTVFWDRAEHLMSLEVGFGGVWALCPPQLLFIPDRNGDDVPDGEPEVVLDGWSTDAVQHALANGLRWGPDGWLYGRQGIYPLSYVGAPGLPRAQRTAVNAGIWRYHPIRKSFEVVCRGTTNPWGMDWNEQGELFFVNTVIGHLWHAVPGAHFQRMFGEDDDPHVYELMGQTADHYHWDTKPALNAIEESLSQSPTHPPSSRDSLSQPLAYVGKWHSVPQDRFGGGHAHAGLMIYQGDNWPDRYRGSLFTINLLGRRLNNDTLERRGCSYIGRHAPDFLKSSDPWFQGVEILSGPDGGAYIADWSDIGECHGSEGVDRSSGRIYKIIYERSAHPILGDLSQSTDDELIALQLHRNVWYSRQSQRLLQERAVRGRLGGGVDAALKKLFETDPATEHKLHALWCLHATGGASEPWLLAQLSQPDEHVRAWIVRFLSDGKTPSPAAQRAFASMALREPSGLVLLYLAASLQQFPIPARWGLAETLGAHVEFAQDPVFSLMVWYGIEPAVADDPSRAVRLAGSSQLPRLVRFTARRLTENLREAPQPVDQLVELASKSGSKGRITSILTGMAEALRGWHKAPMPPSWKSLQATTSAGGDEVRRLVRELSVVFGDGRSLENLMPIAESDSIDTATRRDALRILVEARYDRAVWLLRWLVNNPYLAADAARGLAVFDDPGIADFLVEQFPQMAAPAQDAAIVTLCSRPSWTKSLLRAVASGRIDRQRVPPFQIRQLALSSDDEVRRQLAELWPDLKANSGPKRERINRFKARLDARAISAANLPNGRRRFVQSCATCHVLFGRGTKLGPDLTGAQRTNLDYLLENIVDPSATVAPDYRISTISLIDGRVLNAIVTDHGGPTLTVQTPTEHLFVNRSDIEQIRKSAASLMPEGLLDVLPETEVRDLIAYLMSPQQVPLPNEGHQ